MAISCLRMKIGVSAVILSLACAPLVQAAPKPSAVKGQALDSALVRKLYLDGDFDPAIEILEKGLKEKLPFSHEDSVFMFKHLGVMYAAKYETREWGKRYMHKLLMTEPTARIMDMFASDMIYMIFKNIQDEYESTRGRMNRAEEHVIGNRQPAPAPKPAPKEKPESKGGTAVYWIGATCLVVAVGVAGYFMFFDEPKVKSHSI